MPGPGPPEIGGTGLPERKYATERDDVVDALARRVHGVGEMRRRAPDNPGDHLTVLARSHPFATWLPRIPC